MFWYIKKNLILCNIVCVTLSATCYLKQIQTKMICMNQSCILKLLCCLAGLSDSEWWTEPCLAGAGSQTLRFHHQSLQTQQWVCAYNYSLTATCLYWFTWIIVFIFHLIIVPISQMCLTTYLYTIALGMFLFYCKCLVLSVCGHGIMKFNITTGHRHKYWICNCWEAVLAYFGSVVLEVLILKGYSNWHSVGTSL